MSTQSADLPLATRRPDPLRLRLAFEASSVHCAAALAAELKLIMGEPAKLHPTETLVPGGRTPTGLPSWRVEHTTPPMPLSLAAIYMWERRMLSLEYRLAGSRFLGWTTHAIPEMSARRSAATAEPGPAGDGLLRRQRDLVTESLLRCPSAKRLGIVHGRGPLR